MQERLLFNRLAFDAVRDGYRPGMSENDIKNIIRSTWSASSDRDIEFSGDVVGGVRSAGIEGDATDLLLQKGDSLILDLQPGWDHFWCDTTRTFFIGEPGTEQRRFYNAVVRTLAETEKMLHPGVRACDVYRRMQDTLAEFGLSCPHHAGHGTGSDKVMAPHLVEECTEELRPGMYIALEPGIYIDGKFGIRLENNYLITEDGFDELFGYTLDINNFII